MKLKSNHLVSWFIGLVGIIPILFEVNAVTVIWLVLFTVTSRDIWGNNLLTKE